VLIEGWKAFGSEGKALMAKKMSEPATTRYLDPIQVVKANQTANAANIFDLNTVRGLASHCAIIVRAAGASRKMYNLVIMTVPKCIITIHSRQRYPCSIIIYTTEVQKFLSCSKPLYVGPLCNNVPASYRGTMDGYLPQW
jgi:hypothetical protein